MDEVEVEKWVGGLVRGFVFVKGCERVLEIVFLVNVVCGFGLFYYICFIVLFRLRLLMCLVV